MSTKNICEVDLLTNITENTNAIVEENGSLRRVNLIDMIYPIGSIYMSVNNVDPSLLFGGMWEQLKDRFLLGAGDIYTVGSTGGESEHTLTVDEIPSHTHLIGMSAGGNGTGNDYNYGYIDCNNITPTTNSLKTMSTETGKGTSHNNMPPYLTVNIWKRIS